MIHEHGCLSKCSIILSKTKLAILIGKKMKLETGGLALDRAQERTRVVGLLPFVWLQRMPLVMNLCQGRRFPLPLLTNIVMERNAGRFPTSL